MRRHTEAEFRAVAGLLLLVTAFALAPATESRWTRDFTTWYGANQSRARGSTSSANLAWFESNLLQGCLSEYDATLDTSWLDRFVSHADTMFAVARDVPDTGQVWPGYRDGFRGWGTSHYDPEHRYQEYMVHDGIICLPVARFIRLVYYSPALQVRYLAPARQYQAAIEGNIIAKWFLNWGASRGKGDDLETYGGWRSLPLNMFLAFGELLLVFDDIRQSPAYRCAAPIVPASFYSAVPDSMAQVFYASLHCGTAIDAWTWSYWPITVADTTPEDLSHSNLDVSFALEAAHHGVVFTPVAIKRLAGTFTRLIWNGARVEPRFASLVNGRGRDSLFYLADWIRLAAYDTTIYGLVTRAFDTNPYDPVAMGAGKAQTIAYLARADTELPTDVDERPDPTTGDVTGSKLRVSPNPLVGSGTIDYELAAAGNASITIYDESGRVTRHVMNAEQMVGSHRTTWDCTNDRGEAVPAGVYHCVLATTTSRETAVVIVVRQVPPMRLHSAFGAL